MGSNDGLGFTLLGIGGLLVYSGMKGYGVLPVISNLIAGNPINQNVTNQQPLGSNATPTGTGIGPTPGASTHSASTQTAKDNQNLANSIAREFGWDTGQQWDDLVTLWTRESDWDNTAMNKSSGAYGIPQALPYTKMPKIAWPESAGGKSDPAAQIDWGLNYIAGRYGLPQFALAFHRQNNWY